MGSTDRPLIGIGGDLVRDKGRTFTKLYCEYYDAVRAAGGEAVILPPLDEEASVHAILDRIDALILPGGDDIPGNFFGEETHPRAATTLDRRVRADIVLALRAFERRVPTLGICYGMQLMNVAFGGSLIQDIPSLVPGAIVHRGEAAPSDGLRWTGVDHEVVLDAASRVAKAVGASRLTVYSSHHQAVGRLASSVHPVGQASDGVVEAMEVPGETFFAGVQWHPEKMAAAGNEAGGRSLFEALVREARGRPGAGARRRTRARV